MTQYSDENIIDSKADYLFFAASSMLTPNQIHGDKDTVPLGSMSALASALYNYDNKLATVLAAQLIRAAEHYQRNRRMPLVFIRLDDGRIVAPFIVRRHIADPIDNRLTTIITSVIFERIQAECLNGQVFKYAIERPVDADDLYDRLLSTMPGNVTVHQEIRHE